MPYFDNSNPRHAAWDLSQTKEKNSILHQKDESSTKQHECYDWTNQFSDAASISSSSSLSSSSSSGRSSEPQHDQRFVPVFHNTDSRARTRNNHWTNFSESDSTPRFSGMSLGDVMRITVMKEMDKLNMNKSKAMDLSCKPWNLKKRWHKIKDYHFYLNKCTSDISLTLIVPGYFQNDLSSPL